MSWGYVVQIFPNHIYFPDDLHVQETFRQWEKGNALAGVYMLDTREPHLDPCRDLPFSPLLQITSLWVSDLVSQNVFDWVFYSQCVLMFQADVAGYYWWV